MKKLLSCLSLALLPSFTFALIDFEGLGYNDNESVAGQTFANGTLFVQFYFSSGDPYIEDANNGEFFTNLGGGEYTEDAPILDPYGFLTTNDGDPTKDLSDKTAVGFSGSTWVQPVAGGDLGNHFLRGPFGENFGQFVIDFVYGTVASEISFQIWDIDGNGADRTEKYHIEFYSGFALLGMIDTPEYDNLNPGTSLDGLPFLVAFDAGDELISHVIITFTGTKTDNVGLAFDNFEATFVPEPSTYAAILGLAAIGLVLLRRRRR